MSTLYSVTSYSRACYAGRRSCTSSAPPDLITCQELALKELLIRLMQTQARQLIELNCAQLASTNRFAYIVQYIREDLREKIDMNGLHEKACMSRANFFRKFKETFGCSPGDYITSERINHAKEYLKNPYVSITEVCYMSGFQNLNNFIKTFRKETGYTPKTFQKQNMKCGIINRRLGSQVNTRKGLYLHECWSRLLVIEHTLSNPPENGSAPSQTLSPLHDN